MPDAQHPPQGFRTARDPASAPKHFDTHRSPAPPIALPADLVPGRIALRPPQACLLVSYREPQVQYEHAHTWDRRRSLARVLPPRFARVLPADPVAVQRGKDTRARRRISPLRTAPILRLSGRLPGHLPIVPVVPAPGPWRSMPH